MKKTFNLKSSDLPLPRQLDSIKSEVNKYLKRERKKKLPEGVDFWDFNCRIGLTLDTCKSIHPAEISKAIDRVATGSEDIGVDSFYLEVLAKPGVRTKKRSKPNSNRPTGTEWMAD